MDPDPQSKSSSNVSPHRRDKSRDSLVYLTTCMIGHLVEVHLKNGSVYSGIFHAADVEKDFGIVLKMASLIKDGTLRRHKSRSEFFRKPPFKTFIIPADELVQVVAENLSVSSDGMLNGVQSEKPVEMLTDSSISKSRHVDLGRVLIPWEPDGNVPQGLDNVFDEISNRGWDQFKVNESQFGVKSTFDEEQYTTKLSGSTRTKELEERAQRIAREIEGENTRDVHVAEERGLQLNEKSDIDEETKYSAVRRDDSRFDEDDDKLLDTCNDQTLGGSSTSRVQKSASSSGQKTASSSGKGYENVLGDSQPSRNNTVSSSISESQLGERRENNNPKVSHSSRSAEESVSGHGDSKEGAKFGGGGTSAAKTVAERERQDSQVSGKTRSDSSFGQSVSSSESRPAPSTPSRPGLPPSSSIGSLSSSEKSTLKPDAKFEAAMDPDPQSKSSSNVSPYKREKSGDSLVYFTTCMIDHLVEVHLKNGSVYSGIFHAADVEKDFGIVLKMASLIKDCTLRGHKSRSEFFRKPPFKTLIIPADELVRVVAEDLFVSSDDTLNAVQSEKPVELLTDPSISKSRHVDLGRELTPSEPDGIVPPILDNVFDETSSGKGYEDVRGDSQPSESNTNVDQSCSISGDLGRELTPSEPDGIVPPILDNMFDETSSGKGYEDVRGDSQPSENNTNVDQSCSISGDHARHLPSEQRSKDFPAPGSSSNSESQLGERRKNNNPEVPHSSRSAEESVSGHGGNQVTDIKEGAKFSGGGTSTSKTVAERERQVSQVSGKTISESSFEQSDSRSLESRPAPSTPTPPGIPPSSPIGSLSSSENRTLKPDAKKFKRSQPPAVVPARSPTENTSFYCPAAPIQQIPVQAQSPMEGSYFYSSATPIMQMPVQAQSLMAGGYFYYSATPILLQMPGGYGIQPPYLGEQQMFYYTGQQYGQTGYPQYAQAQYPQQQPQMMTGQPPRPPPPY